MKVSEMIELLSKENKESKIRIIPSLEMSENNSIGEVEKVEHKTLYYFEGEYKEHKDVIDCLEDWDHIGVTPDDLLKMEGVFIYADVG